MFFNLKIKFISLPLHYTFSENNMVDRGPNHHSWDISDKGIKKDALQKFNKILQLQTLIPPKQ